MMDCTLSNRSNLLDFFFNVVAPFFVLFLIILLWWKVNKMSVTPPSSRIDDCPICMEPLPRQKQSVTRCTNNHKFCKGCVHLWAREATSDVTCPLCRVTIRSRPQFGSNNITSRPQSGSNNTTSCPQSGSINVRSPPQSGSNNTRSFTQSGSNNTPTSTLNLEETISRLVSNAYDSTSAAYRFWHGEPPLTLPGAPSSGSSSTVDPQSFGASQERQDSSSRYGGFSPSSISLREHFSRRSEWIGFQGQRRVHVSITPLSPQNEVGPRSHPNESNHTWPDFRDIHFISPFPAPLSDAARSTSRT